ncbi:DUF2231 domain-containing protein [Fulvivirgaceae bacterium BMA10]|uniref:DUF2231 domain-containing protein n=1 Tax=Splendidivirga corallicola TaxID=3051826 RepID=A0ABT8KYD4_9BACT|nr:DUF2231 domain-containing protein [Fulvivirgaceae bacterium BMA10]
MKEFFRGRFLGHPIHVMLIHFPSALLPISWLFDLMAFVNGDTNFAFAATYCLVAGVSGAILAAIFGAIDYLAISPEHKAWKIASYHALFNVVWLVGFVIMTGIKLKINAVEQQVSFLYLLVYGILLAGLFVTNYLGGELVLRHKIGQRN